MRLKHAIIKTNIMHTYKTKIKLHETDAAGLLFFSNQFKIVHDAYETLLEEMGFGFACLLKQKDYFLPIVHAEADYKVGLFVGDEITITIHVEKIGETSFTFIYELHKDDGELVGTAKTVHVTMDKKLRKKIPLPVLMKEKLKSHIL